MIADIKMCIHLTSFVSSSLNNIKQRMLDLKIAFSNLLLVFSNKAEKSAKIVSLPSFIVACLLFLALSSYCETSGHLTKLPSHTCGTAFLVYILVCLLKAKLNYWLIVTKPVLFKNEACNSIAISALHSFLLLCSLYMVCALLVPFLLINRMLNSFSKTDSSKLGIRPFMLLVTCTHKP